MREDHEVALRAVRDADADARYERVQKAMRDARSDVADQLNSIRRKTRLIVISKLATIRARELGRWADDGGMVP